MADTSTRITNFPDSGSPARVALEMMKYLRETVEEDVSNKRAFRSAYLDLYAECLYAANGYRSVPKQ